MVSTTLEKAPGNQNNDSPRVAWLLQGAGAYYQPILSEFTRLFSQTTVFTASWPGFLPGFENSFTVKQVGEIKVIEMTKFSKSYSPAFTYLSPSIVSHLLQFSPDVVFSTGFSVWTILALLFKVWGKWRVVIIYDGSSPGVDHQGSWLRLLQRRTIARFTDAFITNTHAGKAYLTEVIGSRENCIFKRPFLMPHPKTYEHNLETSELTDSQLQRPIFLFVGQFIPRKGLQELLQACAILQGRGYQDYTLLIIGWGWQEQELQLFTETHNLKNQVKWIGNVEYKQVGAYYQKADVFVFPTLEDVWGLVAVEAMMFGNPILCSKWAGAVEIVMDGENGYVFDPHNPEELAELMSRLIDNPNLVNSMGEKSKQIMANHTPETVSKFLGEVVEFVLNHRQETWS